MVGRHGAEDRCVFALANPEPEVFAEELAADTVIATGRSDFPNQINNSLCFPGFFRGALDRPGLLRDPGHEAGCHPCDSRLRHRRRAGARGNRAFDVPAQGP